MARYFGWGAEKHPDWTAVQASDDVNRQDQLSEWDRTRAVCREKGAEIGRWLTRRFGCCETALHVRISNWPVSRLDGAPDGSITGSLCATGAQIAFFGHGGHYSL
jgi:hypothetical protein